VLLRADPVGSLDGVEHHGVVSIPADHRLALRVRMGSIADGAACPDASSSGRPREYRLQLVSETGCGAIEPCRRRVVVAREILRRFRLVRESSFPSAPSNPVPRRYRVVPARTRYLAGTAHARSLAPWSAGHAREGIWCRVGTRWYPLVPAGTRKYPLATRHRLTGSSGTHEGLSQSSGSVLALRATAANSTLVVRTRHHPRSRVRGAQIIANLGLGAQIA
jgi:hypothetical protein